MFILNSKLVNADQISLSINSASLNYAFSLFETVKIYCGNPQLLKEHIDRINNSLEILKIDYILDYDLTNSSVELLLSALDVDSGAVKILVFENDGIYHSLISYNNRVYDDKLYKSGYKITLSNYKSNESSIFTYHKSSNYGDNIFALRDAKAKGYDEVIFENSRGNISEGSLSNIFIVKDNLILTPPISSGILNGIMREKVIETIRKMDLDFFEKEISYNDLLEADEIFLTNSLMNMMPVISIDNNKFDLKSYNLFKKIRKQLHLTLEEDYCG